MLSSSACLSTMLCTGYWDVSVGGHMTAGDDSLVTATKETAEELGIEVKPEQFEVTCS
jgi:isopentenyl-diphosphate Delta-isomerase